MEYIPNLKELNINGYKIEDKGNKILKEIKEKYPQIIFS